MSSTPWIDEHCHDFLEDELFSDVTLSIGESGYRAHKVILANASKYFDRKFIAQEDCEEVDLQHLNIPSSLFSIVMYFLYTGGYEKLDDDSELDTSETKVPSMIHNGNILSLWKCSVELEIDSLHQHCRNFFIQYARLVDSSCAQQLSNWLNKCPAMHLEDVEGAFYSPIIDIIDVILTIIGSKFSSLINLEEIETEEEDLSLITNLSSSQFIKFLKLEVLDVPNEFFVFQLVLKYLDWNLLQKRSTDLLDEFEDIVDKICIQSPTTNNGLTQQTVEEIWNQVRFEFLEDSQLIEIQENFSNFEKYMLPSNLIIQSLIFKLQQRTKHAFPKRLGRNFSGSKNAIGCMTNSNNEFYVWYLGNTENMELNTEYVPRCSGHRNVMYDMNNEEVNVKCKKKISNGHQVLDVWLEDKECKQAIFVKIEGTSQTTILDMSTQKEVSIDLEGASKEVVLKFYLLVIGQVLPAIVPADNAVLSTPEEEDIKPVIRTNYSSFFNSSYFSDIQLECEGKHIPAHRIILCCGSNYFKSMFTMGWKEVSKELELTDIKFDILYDIIRFLYCGSVKLTELNVIPMWLASEYYQIDALQNACEEYLAQVPDSQLLDFIGQASHLHATALEDVFLHRLRINFGNVLNQVKNISDWNNLSVAQVVEILSNDTIGSTDEHHLYEFCVQFLKMKQATETISEEIKAQLLECIRFPFFSHQQLLQALKNEDLFPLSLKQDKIVRALSHKLARVESVEAPLMNYGESQARPRSLDGTAVASIALSSTQPVLETQEEFSDRLRNTWKLKVKSDMDSGILSVYIECVNSDPWTISMLNQPIPATSECSIRLINHKEVAKGITKSFLFDYRKAVESHQLLGYQQFYKISDVSSLQSDGFIFDSKMVVEVSFLFQVTDPSSFVKVLFHLFLLIQQLSLELEEQHHNIEAELAVKDPDNGLLEWLLTKQYLPDNRALIIQLNQPTMSLIQLNISKLASPLDMLFMDRDYQIVNIFKVGLQLLSSHKTERVLGQLEINKTSLLCGHLKGLTRPSLNNIFQAHTVDTWQLTCDFQVTMK